MIVLKGVFPYFSLSSVLKLLYATKKTGILRLKRKDKLINLHILDGKPVGLEPTSGNYTNDLSEISIWLNGEFGFEPAGGEGIIKNISMPVDQLILLLAKKEKESKEIKKLLPSLETVMVMNPSKQNGEIRLQPDEWNFLSKVDGKKTLEQLVQIMDLDELSVYAIAAKLIQKGILLTQTQGQGNGETQTKIKATTPLETKRNQKENHEASENLAGHLHIIEKAFMRYVGPMGTIILDEIIESMGYDRESLSKQKISELVEKMCLEIDSEEDKHQFEEEVFKILDVS